MTAKSTSLRERSSVALVAVLAAVIVTASPQIASAAPTPAGPAFPPPGGVSTSTSPAEGTPPNDGFIGKTGGSTITYSSFGGSFSHLWWGPNQTSAFGTMPAVALDNAIDSASERLTLFSISGNVSIWGAGTSNLKYISGGTYTTVPVSTRFRMIATRTSDNSAINWVTAATAGVATNVAAVIPVPLSSGVPQSFKVMRIFEACRAGLTVPNVASCNTADANWEPVNTMYNRLQTDPAVSTRSSWSAGFYYNRAPSALSSGVSTNEDTPLSIGLGSSDPDGNALSYTIVSGPSNGVLTGSGATRTYTPAPNSFGADSFSFKVNDGFVDSTAATVSITVNPVNDIPVATPQSVTLDEDASAGITLSGTDVETATLDYEVVTGPGFGTLDVDALPDVTYAPNANYNGADSFTFRAFDGTAYSPPATITLTIDPVNDAPEAFDQLTGTPEDVELDLVLGSADIDGDAVTFTIVDAPLHGTLTGDGPDMHFVPELNYSGFDTFTYLVNDGALDSNIATVTIEIPPVNDAPVSYNAELSTDEDTDLDLTLLADDVDNINDELTYEVLSGPSGGVLVGDGPDLTYVPSLNFNGTDTITFRANDGEYDSNVATITITVNAVNDVPEADDLSLTTAEDTGLGITLTGTDLDGDGITFAIVDGPEHGTLTGDAPNLIYTPDLNYFGEDTFTFVTNDGEYDSAAATVTIDVTPVNDVPIADAQSVSTDEDAPLVITLTGSDIEGSALTFSVLDGPTNGLLSGEGDSLVYTPFDDFNGSDSFTFTVNDGELESAPATVTVTIGAVNDAPVAADDTASVEQYSSVTFEVLSNDSDVDLDTITVTEVTDGATGAASLNEDGTITYVPNPNFKGSDTLTYTIDDGAGGTATGTVSILEIGCGEDGIDALDGTPAEGAPSQTIDQVVEPIIGGVDPDTAANVHANNCAYVVPTENALDDALNG